MLFLTIFVICFAAVCFGAFFWMYRMEATGRNMTLRKRLEPVIFIFPALFLLLIMFGYPLINSVIIAFKNYIITKPKKIHFNGFDNFVKLFADRDIGMIIKNSFVYVIVCVGAQFILGMTLALALRKKFRGRGIYQAIVFLPWAFSAFVVGLMFRWMFNGEYGVINDFLLKIGVFKEKIAFLGTPGLSLLVVMLAMIWMGVPFFAIMNLAALQSIPKEVYEAADMDGCGNVKRFFSITLPYIKPTVIMTLLLRTIWIFNSFDLIVIITGGGPANTSQTLPSYMYTKAFSSYDFGLACALGVLLMVTLAIYSVFFLKVTKYEEAGDF